jgi:prepilin-type processing-associated H-X9-DG protein
MYSNESKGGKYPPIATFGYNHSLNGPALYPEYMTDIKITVCPSDGGVNVGDVSEMLETVAAGDPNGVYASVANFADPVMRKHGLDWITSQHYSYGYFMWAVTDDNAYAGYLQARPAIRDADPYYQSHGAVQNVRCFSYDKDWTLATPPTPRAAYNNAFPNETPVYHMGSSGGNTLYRIKEGVERFFITDINNPAGSAQAQSSILVYMDAFGAAMSQNGTAQTAKIAERFNHVPGGSNILYMDGHVEFLKYPGKFPMTHFMSTQTLGGGDSADFKTGQSFLYITQ